MPHLSSSNPRHKIYAVEAGMAIAGIVLSLVLYCVLRRMEWESIREQFTSLAVKSAWQMEQRFANDARSIYSLAGQYGRRGMTSAEDFQALVDGLAEEDRDVAAAFLARYVHADRRSEFEEQVRRAGAPEYHIRSDEVGDVLAESPFAPDDAVVVQFVAPADKSENWLGYDLARSPEHLAAIKDVLDQGRLQGTSPVLFEGDTVCFIYRGVFRGAVLRESDERFDRLLGFVAIAIPVERTLKNAFRAETNEEVNVQVARVTPSGQIEFAFAYNADTQSVQYAELPSHEFRYERSLDTPGLPWRIRCTPGAKFLDSQRKPTAWIALLLGLLLTAVGVAYAHAVMVRKARVEQLVDQRTAELQHANESLELQVQQRKHAERKLRESERRFRSLVENTNDFIFELDPEGVFTYVSPQVMALLGYSQDEVLGKRFCDLLVDEHRHVVAEFFRTAVENSDSRISVENEFQHKSKGPVVMETNARPIFDNRGVLLGYRGISRDVTARVTAEKKLAYERFLLDTLLTHSLDFIYFKDTQSRFIRISKALATYFGLDDPADAVGKTDFDVFDPEFAAQFFEDEQRVMQTGEPIVNQEEEQISPQGKRLWMSTTKVCLRDANGKVIGTFGISRDVTARRRATETIQRAKEEAEAVSRAKSAFLANMSHEIRTPMNAVIGMTELLLETELTPFQREYLNMILESGESLLTVLNDILDFSKIEAGKLSLESENFELRETIGDTMKALAFRAHAKGLELLCSIASNVPECLRGDDERLKQIVINLVTNAIKFTPQGEVILSVELKEISGRSAVLHFTVSDTGVGIPQDKLNGIFDAFVQADSSRRRKFGGTGLGLSICEQLCALMNGRIWAESDEGIGSQFHFELPFEVIQQSQPTVPPAGIPGRRMLIVDDNFTNCEIMAEMLKSWEIQPDFVHDPEQAEQRLEAAANAGQPFDVAIVDELIGEFDGFACARRIAENASLNCNVIMMLTAGDRPAEIARCEELGMRTHVLKPVKRSDLFNAIATVLDVATADASGVEAADNDEPEIAPLSILLAEDNVVNQRLAIGLLSRRGHTLVIANNGKEAIEAFERERFDLILMDVEMPEMDGFEATAEIRAREQGTGHRTPILAMTAHAMKGDRERCLAGGMDGYIPKPVRAKVLFLAIRDVLQKFQQQ